MRLCQRSVPGDLWPCVVCRPACTPNSDADFSRSQTSQAPLNRTTFYESRRSSPSARSAGRLVEATECCRLGAVTSPCCEAGPSRARAAPCGPSCKCRLRRPGSGRSYTRSRGECPRTTLKPSRTFCRPRHSSDRLSVRACCRLLGGAVPELRAMGHPAGAARPRTRHEEERPGPPLLPPSLERRVPERRPSLGAPVCSGHRLGRTLGMAPAASTPRP